MTFFDVQGLTKKFNDIVAVDEVTLRVSEGEILVLLGPSGCGKTTFLRLIAGLETPDCGEIFVAGNRVNDLPPHQRNIAMVFQNYALYPHMTAEQNLEFALKIAGMKKEERDTKTADAAQLLSITHLLQKRPAQCSGGERQRIALGRAIVRNPSLFLFDEPLSNLDAGLRETLRVELRALLKKLGATALYVTHDQSEAMTIGDRVAVINHGRLEQEGSPREVYDDPQTEFVAGFLGRPKANKFCGVCSGGIFKAEAGFELHFPYSFTGEVHLLVRPENLRLSDDGFVRGKLVSVEYQGDRSILFADFEGETFAAIHRREGKIDALQTGSEVCFTCERSSMLWFNAKTGGRIFADKES